jgi:hypothetical protein
MTRLISISLLALAGGSVLAQAHSGHTLADTILHGFWHLANTTEFLPVIAVLGIAGLLLLRRKFTQIN